MANAAAVPAVFHQAGKPCTLPEVESQRQSEFGTTSKITVPGNGICTRCIYDTI